MTKIVRGFEATGDVRLNKLEGLVQNMKDNGVSTAGQAFMYGDRSIQKPITYVDPQAPPLASQQTNKAERIIKGTAGFIGGLAKNTGKKVYTTLIENTIVNPAKDLAFQATHNFQNRSSFYRNKNKQASTEYIDTKNKLVSDLKQGTISQSDYERELKTLDETVGKEVVVSNQKYQEAQDQQYKIKDWRTGKYKTPTIGDVFDVLDAGISVASVGTAGLFKAGASQLAKTNFTKAVGRDMFVDGLEKIGLKRASKAASTTASKVDGVVSKFITKVPGLKEYTDRQIIKLGGDITAKTFAKNAVAETLLHAPLREMNMTSARDIVNSIREDRFLETPEGKSWLSSGAGQAFMMAGMALEGGPIGFALNTFKKSGKAIKVATFGDDLVSDARVIGAGFDDKAIQSVIERGGQDFEGTYLDHVFRLSDEAGDAENGWKWLASNKELVPALKSIQETLSNGRVAASAAQASVAGAAKDLLAAGEKVTIESVMKHMLNFQKAGELATAEMPRLVAKGIIKDGEKVVVIRFGRQHLNKLVDNITKVVTEAGKLSRESGAGSGMALIAQKKAAEEFITQAISKGEYWTQHDGLIQDMFDGIRSAASAKQIAGSLKAINTAKYVKGVSKETAKQLSDLGYIIGKPDIVKHPFVSIAEAAGSKLQSVLVGEVKNGWAKTMGLTKSAKIDELTEVLGDDTARVMGRSPAFSGLGKMLDKIGIGMGSGSQEAYRMVRTSAINRIDELGAGVSGVSAMKQLQDYAENSKTINDLRQMTKNEIAKALNISKDSAAKVQQAIIKGHLDVGLEIRGLADKAVDVAMQIPLQRIYSRVQGALRYTYNPFFKVQEISETKLLGSAATSGRTAWMSTFGRLNPKNRARLEEVVRKMEAAGVLDNTLYGEAATNVALGRINARITKTQKLDLAAVVDDLAAKTGMNLDELFASRGQDIIDLVKPIVQYPTKGAINSHMAKMMNLAAFPARYNMKVAGLAAKALSEQTPLVQGAVLRGIWDFQSWLKSDAGLTWQQDYANEIRFFKWLTPVGSIEWTMKQLQGDRSSWADVGQLGGLPFGVWSQILHNQGVIDLQSPYVDPKNGEIYSTKIPVTVKGRMAMAITDMLGSTFTYPGRTVGLPVGKAQLTREAAERIVGSGRGDFDTIYHSPEELSPSQREAQKFWMERFEALGIPPPKKTTPQQPMLYKGNIVGQTPQAPRPEATSKVDIEKLKAQSAAPTGKKKKTPVNFEQIITR